MSTCRPKERLGEAAGGGVCVSWKSGICPQKLNAHRQYLCIRQQVGSLLLISLSFKCFLSRYVDHRSHLRFSEKAQMFFKIRYF